jgi:hypothetical protein
VKAVRHRVPKDEPRFLLQAKLKHARSMSNLSKAYQQVGVGHAYNNYHTVHAGGWTPPRRPPLLSGGVSSSDDTDMSDDVDTDLDDDEDESLLRYGRGPPAHGRRYAVRACALHAANCNGHYALYLSLVAVGALVVATSLLLKISVCSVSCSTIILRTFAKSSLLLRMRPTCVTPHVAILRLQSNKFMSNGPKRVACQILLVF